MSRRVRDAYPLLTAFPCCLLLEMVVGRPEMAVFKFFKSVTNPHEPLLLQNQNFVSMGAPVVLSSLLAAFFHCYCESPSPLSV